jgi:flagellar FliJ protein
MARFHFRLDAILRLRQEERDRRRQELAAALAAEQLLATELTRLQAERLQLQHYMTQAAAPGQVPVENLLDARRYELVLAGQERHLEEQRKKLAAEIDRRRQALLQADAAVKVLEKLRERRLRQHEQEESRRLARQTDELVAMRASLPSKEGSDRRKSK